MYSLHFNIVINEKWPLSNGAFLRQKCENFWAMLRKWDKNEQCLFTQQAENSIVKTICASETKLRKNVNEFGS